MTYVLNHHLIHMSFYAGMLQVLPTAIFSVIYLKEQSL